MKPRGNVYGVGTTRNARQYANLMEKMPSTQTKFTKKKPETYGSAAAKEFVEQYADGLYRHLMIDDITHCTYNKTTNVFEERNVEIYDLFNLNRLHDLNDNTWSLKLIVDPSYKDLLMLRPDLKNKCIEILEKVKENIDKEIEND